MAAQKKQPRWLEYQPLGAVEAALVNPKDHNEGLIAASITRFGYIVPIVLDERTLRLVSGHGRARDLRARLAAGEPPPEGIVAESDGTWLVPVNRGWHSANDDEAHAAGLAINQGTISGGFKRDELAELLEQLQGTPDGLTGVGWTDAGLADLLATLAPAPSLDDLADELGEPLPDDFWPTVHIKVPPALEAAWKDHASPFSDPAAAFADLLGQPASEAAGAPSE